MTFQAIRCPGSHGLNHGSPVLARVDWDKQQLELYCRKCKRSVLLLLREAVALEVPGQFHARGCPATYLTDLKDLTDNFT